MATSPDIDVAFAGDDLVLRLASAAYLARYTGTSREHCTSDLRLYFVWCTEHQLTPLSMIRPQIERYVGWMREIRRYKPATVARRMAVVAGFYRTCVIDGVLEHSPAEYVRRPRVANESPTLGFRISSSRLCCRRRGTRPTGSTSRWW